MSADVKLRPCPFCGSDAEIYTGERPHILYRTMLETEEEALAILEDFVNSGMIDKKIEVLTNIGRWIFPKEGADGEEKTYYTASARVQRYVPRCLNPKCLGRTQKKFNTEADAIEAWNGRGPA